MKIALIGFGKMGKAIEEIALKNGHQVCLRITSTNIEDFTRENLEQCDVAIEFSTPENAVNNIKICIDANIPVISGTTGWLDKYEDVKNYCIQKNGALLYASNFSIGVNIFFSLNTHLAALMKNYPAYNSSIEEIHHTQKKDSPSGTAITLAEQIISTNDKIKGWSLNQPEKDKITITSKRIDPAPGTHFVKYSSEVDDIEIIHTAHNRSGFAQGAVAAAEYIKDKKGIFSMKDVLGI